MIDFRMAPHQVIAVKNIVEVLLDGAVVATIAADGIEWYSGPEREFKRSLVGRRREGRARHPVDPHHIQRVAERQECAQQQAMTALAFGRQSCRMTKS